MEVFFQWQGREVTPDLKAAASLPEGPERENLIAGMLSNRSDEISRCGITPAEAAQLPDFARKLLAETLGPAALTSGNVQDARNWAQLLSPRDGDTFATMAVSASEASDPAMRQLGTELISRAQASSLTTAYADRVRSLYSEQGSDAALAHAVQLPDACQPEAVAALISSMVLQDETSAAQSVQGLPPGALRDTAATSLVAGIAATDPASALIWARSIQDPARQQAALRGMAESLLRDDYLSGKQFLDHASLSAEEQATVAEAQASYRK